MARAKRAKEEQLKIEAVEARVKQDLADELSAAALIALNERAEPVFDGALEQPKGRRV